MERKLLTIRFLAVSCASGNHGVAETEASDEKCQFKPMLFEAICGKVHSTFTWQFVLANTKEKQLK